MQISTSLSLSIPSRILFPPPPPSTLDAPPFPCVALGMPSSGASLPHLDWRLAYIDGLPMLSMLSFCKFTSLSNALQSEIYSHTAHQRCQPLRPDLLAETDPTSPPLALARCECYSSCLIPDRFGYRSIIMNTTLLFLYARGLSAFYGKPTPDDERFALLDTVYESGQRFIDTADVYA